MMPSSITKYAVCLFIVSVLLQAYTARCCLQQEKMALLQLKAYFMSASSSTNREYLSHELRSWDGEDGCCAWSRVTCNTPMQRVTQLALNDLIRETNQVDPYHNVLNLTLFQTFSELISLDLSSNNINDLVGGNNTLNLRSIEILNLGHNLLLMSYLTFVGSLTKLKKLFLNGNLFSDFSLEDLARLKQLQVLDLSGNYLFESLEGDALANMTELQVLNLSNNSYYDLIEPEGLCKLRKLQRLTLDSSHVSVKIPECLWNLTSLQVLDLSGNRCTGTLPQYINLPSLERLSISDNDFRGRFSLTYLLNQSRLLKVVSLSNNALQVEIQDTLPSSHIKFLSLGLGHCNLVVQGKTFPKFLLYQSSLKYIDLSGNSLIGSFPTWLLQNNSNLEYLNLRNNSLTGSLRLPEQSTLPLLHLDVSHNKFSGDLPQHIGTVLSSLQVFSMSANSFNGQIPSSVGKMTQLLALDLSDNKLSGKVPGGLYSNCTLLMSLVLSKNYLQGDIVPSYMNLTSLYILYLDNNYFGGTIKESLKIPRYLQDLDMSNNIAQGELPRWIGSLDRLTSLSLRRNRFHGRIPSSLCNLEDLFYLDLSDNGFNGQIPSCDKLLELTFLHMRANTLVGAIPIGLANSSSLRTLDLGYNNLSGGIPPWINELGFQLAILLLEGNQLGGELPIQLCQGLEQVSIINLSNNSISGAIPPCFGNLSFGAREISGDLPNFTDPNTIWNSFADELTDIDVQLDQRSEEVDFIVKSRYASYKGSILSFMSALDLSCNKLTGGIPPELGQLGMIHALNLSHNHLSGSIPSSFSRLKSIESLDLSSNNLSGKIPSQLVDLNFLEIFNVSYNNLSGEVPETGQFGDFDEANYRENPLLCGSLLPKSCKTSPSGSYSTNEETQGGDEGFDKAVFLWSFGMSYITIVLAIIAVLAINPHWRRAWFAFIDVRILWWFRP